MSCKNEHGAYRVLEYKDTLYINKGLINSKCRVKTLSDNTYFEGYNKSENRIVLIDIDSSKEIFSVIPNINYNSDSAGRFIQFDIYKIDSIFVITENNIFIVNEVGKVIYKKDVSEPIVDAEGSEYRLWDNDNQFPLYYDSNKKELLIRSICNCSFMEPKYTSKRIEVKLNLVDDRISFFDYSFPERYKWNSYGQAVFPFREINGETDVLSFPSDDTLYTFNRSSGKLKKNPCKSLYQESNFIPFDTNYSDDIERVKEHLTVIPMYQKILKDKYRGRYYRFFQKEQSLKDEKGEYRNLFDKDLVVMVLDTNFKVIQENNIGNSFFGFYSFVTPKGLYILKYDKQNLDSQKKYAIFSVFNWN